MTGLVISGFGLSAFFFSALAHLFFPGDVGSLLLLLALGTSLPMIGGYFVVRPIPLPDTNNVYEPLPDGIDERDVEGGADCSRRRRTSFADLPHDGFAHVAGVDSVLSEDVLVYEHTDDSHTHLLVNSGRVHPHQDSQFEHEDGDEEALSRSVELSVSPPRGHASKGSGRKRSLSNRSRRSHSKVIEVMREVHGKALVKSADFWMLTLMLSLRELIFHQTIVIIDVL